MKDSFKPNIHIESFHADGSNISFGNVYDSNFSIDNSYNELLERINKEPDSDKGELKNILLEVKDYIDNITNLKTITKNTGLFTRIDNHFQKHQWFYQGIINLIGTAVINSMSGK